MAIVLGIDTGGTYTDAVLVDHESGRIVAGAKALTTHERLENGIHAAIERLLALPEAQGVRIDDVRLVSVSTTLATNAVVEGHGSPVGVVLVGFDDRMAERTGIASAFPGLPIIRIAGGHDHNGAPISPSRRRWTRLRSPRRSRCAMRRMSRPCATTSWPPPASR